MAKVQLENVVKSYGDKKVVNDVSLQIEDKQFTTLLGPPGAGKTTILRTVAGLVRPDSGKVYFDGKDVTNLTAKDRNVSMVFQSFALYPNKSVYENIEYPIKVKGLPKSERKQRVTEVANMLGISELLLRHPNQLSGGEMQRVSIGRALAKDADVYLFDEPLTNLDYKLRESMRGELKGIFKKRGGTLIYATPDPLDVLSMSEYVAVMDSGVVQQHGPVTQVYESPSKMFVGRYFSFPSMNIIESKIIREGAKYVLDCAGILIDVPRAKQDMLEGLSDVLLGFRPDQLSLVGEKDEKEVKFECRLELTEVIGSETIVHLSHNDTELTMLLPTIYRGEMGKTVLVGLRLEALYLFRSSDKSLITRLAEKG